MHAIASLGRPCATEVASAEHAQESRQPGQREVGVHASTDTSSSACTSLRKNSSEVLKYPAPHWHRSSGSPAGPTPYSTASACSGHEKFWAAAPGGKHPDSPPSPRKCWISQARSPATARATNKSQGRSRRLRCVVSLLRQRGSCHRAVRGASRRARHSWTLWPAPSAPLCPSISGRVSCVCASLLRSELDPLHDMRLSSQFPQQAAGARAGRGPRTIWRRAGVQEGRSALERCAQVVTMSTPAEGQTRSASPARAGRLAALGPPAPRPPPSACVPVRRHGHAHRAWKRLKRNAPAGAVAAAACVSAATSLWQARRREQGRSFPARKTWPRQRRLRSAFKMKRQALFVDVIGHPANSRYERRIGFSSCKAAAAAGEHDDEQLAARAREREGRAGTGIGMSARLLRGVLLAGVLTLELLSPARAATVRRPCACPQTEPTMGRNLQQVVAWQRPSQADDSHSQRQSQPATVHRTTFDPRDSKLC